MSETYHLSAGYIYQILGISIYHGSIIYAVIYSIKILRKKDLNWAHANNRMNLGDKLLLAHISAALFWDVAFDIFTLAMKKEGL